MHKYQEMDGTITWFTRDAFTINMQDGHSLISVVFSVMLGRHGHAPLCQVDEAQRGEMLGGNKKHRALELGCKGRGGGRGVGVVSGV